MSSADTNSSSARPAVGSVVQSIGGTGAASAGAPAVDAKQQQADDAARESAAAATPVNIRTQTQQDAIDADMVRRGFTPTGPGSATIVGSASTDAPAASTGNVPTPNVNSGASGTASSAAPSTGSSSASTGAASGIGSSSTSGT